MAKRKKLLLIGFGSLVVLSVIGKAYCLGRQEGISELCNKLMALYEKDPKSYVLSVDKNTGLIYEIKAECIGD